MSYVNINTLEVVEAANIMLAHPEVSFPNKGWTDEDLAPFGYAILWMPAEHPFPGTYEKLVKGTPQKIGDKWYHTLEIVPMTEAEVAEKKVLLRQDLFIQTQQHLDLFAQSKGYDNMLSLCTYATSTNPQFQAEGQYGVQMRDETWAALYSILSNVDTGNRLLPESFSEIYDELPVLQWPNTN